MSTRKPVMVIGAAARHWESSAVGIRPDRWRHIVDLMLERYEPVLQEIVDGNVVHYDMEVFPERGDALDHFHEVSAVIADHLYYDCDGPSGSPFFYCKKNNEIVDRAQKAKIPLFIIGDYPWRARKPDYKNLDLRVYEP